MVYLVETRTGCEEGDTPYLHKFPNDKSVRKFIKSEEKSDWVKEIKPQERGFDVIQINGVTFHYRKPVNVLHM